MLYAAYWEAVSQTAQILGEESGCFRKRYEKLKQKVQDFYWDERQKTAIAENVLMNPQIPAITTPYFKFYELDALGRMGYLEEVLQQMKDYWGGMLERGAVTFWEEYDPGIPEEEQYDMYGDKFGKSLCHAWSASPIYLLAKYFAGLTVTDPVHGKYEWNLYREAFGYLDCTLPVGNRNVHIHWDGDELLIS